MKKSDIGTKKGLKTLVKNRGFFCSLAIDTEKNAPAEFENKVPEGATYFEGVASTGELNRNGYIIREKAWKSAIDDFFTNPVVLLQHNLDEPIGQGLWAKVTSKGLTVGGYLFDELTQNRFGKGLLKALSTGHITQAVEFENEKTGEIITEEEYRARRDKGEIGWGDTTWILAVTKLEWVEFSLVSIGSNRASFITKHDAIETYLKNGAITENGIAEILKKNEEEENKDNAENKEKSENEDDNEDEKENKDEKENEEESSKENTENKGDNEDEEKKEEEESSEEEPKKDEEKPEAEKAEGAEDENSAKKIKISAKDRKHLEECAKNLELALESTEGEEPADEKKPDDAEEKPADEGEKSDEKADEDGGTDENKIQIPAEVRTAIESIVSTNQAQAKEISELKAKIEKHEAAPEKKGLIYSSQFGGGAPKKSDAKKSEAEKKSDGGKSAIDFLKASGVDVEIPAK